MSDAKNRPEGGSTVPFVDPKAVNAGTDAPPQDAPVQDEAQRSIQAGASGPVPSLPYGSYWESGGFGANAQANFSGSYIDRRPVPAGRPKRLGALFVDFENIFLAFRDVVTRPLEMTLHVLTTLRDELELEHGVDVVFGRAYGSWEYGATRDALSHLSLLGIVPQYVLSRPQKSSADLKLSIDLMEVLLTRSDISAFIIAGGDRDYMPIAEKIKEQAKTILVVSPGQATSGDLIALVGMESFIDATTMLPPDAQPATAARRTRASSGPVHTVLPVVDRATDGHPSAKPTSDQAESSHPETATASSRSEQSSQETPIAKLEASSDHAAADGSIVPKSVSVTPEEEVKADQALRMFMHEYAIEDLWRCVGLFLRAQEELKRQEIWVGPFLKNYMNEEFDFMNNAQRKRLLTIMDEVGAISVTEKMDRMGEQTYSVILVNWDSPIIRTGLMRRG
ncbi:MAG: NYN domain-containing protein [Deltaproteobacteria bacterium]|nr:NYN domain-containing protein [Deltaproteobacteria bacterium]